MKDFDTFKNLPKNGYLGQLVVAKGLKKLPKVQKIAKSGHTVNNVQKWGKRFQKKIEMAPHSIGVRQNCTLATFLPTYLPVYLPTSIPTYLQSYLPA